LSKWYRYQFQRFRASKAL